MRAGDLISDEIPTLEGSDNALFAMQLLDEYKMKQLPVVDGNEYLGLISEDAVLDAEDPETPLRNYGVRLQPVYVNHDQHAYDIVRAAAQFQLSAVPILGPDNKYLGVVSVYCLVRELSQMAAVNETGGILVLELDQSDYSLTEIARIVESNDAKILSANVTSSPDSKKMEVTLKVNRTHMDGIIQTFLRFDYTISASYHESSVDDMMKNRYEELMRYLNL